MQYIDVFNGDADGICALHQMRLAHPVSSILVTGIKRDISLLKKVTYANEGDSILTLDISLDKNREALVSLLNQGVNIEYFDHHYAGDIPKHDKLSAHINTDPDTCTSLLVNQQLENKFLLWAVTAAFGDNLHKSAITAATPLNLSATQLEQLEQLGTCINYNGYGSCLDDLIFHPDKLYQIIQPYENPFEFIKQDDNYQKLLSAYKEDLYKASQCKAELATDSHTIMILPNEKWARRSSGVFANQLATQNPDKAHAMLTDIGSNNYLVSVRAPLNNKTGADELCRQFETGGGRKAAAGINKLPATDYDLFVEKFTQSFL